MPALWHHHLPWGSPGRPQLTHSWPTADPTVLSCLVLPCLRRTWMSSLYSGKIHSQSLRGANTRAPGRANNRPGQTIILDFRGPLRGLKGLAIFAYMVTWCNVPWNRRMDNSFLIYWLIWKLFLHDWILDDMLCTGSNLSKLTRWGRDTRHWLWILDTVSLCQVSTQILGRGHTVITQNE